jgi:hypothetical protein
LHCCIIEPLCLCAIINKPTPGLPLRSSLAGQALPRGEPKRCNLHYNISVLLEQNEQIFIYFTFPNRGVKWRNAGSE